MINNGPKSRMSPFPKVASFLFLHGNISFNIAHFSLKYDKR
jgi:hypothetical protein